MILATKLYAVYKESNTDWSFLSNVRPDGVIK
jgi:hypothetical protein